MCGSGINNTGTMDLNTKKGINTPYYKNLIVICTYQKQCHVLQCYVMLRLLSMNNEQWLSVSWLSLSFVINTITNGRRIKPLQSSYWSPKNRVPPPPKSPLGFGVETYDISDYLPVSCSVLKNTRRKKEKVETLQVTQNTVILSEIAHGHWTNESHIFTKKSYICSWRRRK